MKIDNKHRFLIIAVISVVMIAAYEGYWLSGLYKSQRQSLEMQISSLISKSELAAYSFQLKREQLTDSIAFLSPDNLSKIVSIKRDSSFGNKIRSISVYRRDDFNKQVASSVTSPEFYEMMDSILFQNFKEAGIDEIFRPLDTPDVVSDTDSASAGYIIVKSTLGKKLYSFDTGLMTGYILLNMSGIIFTSLMVVAIVIFSFWFFINTLKKQMEFDEMKSSFTSNITHELKTPIAVAYAANDALLNYGLADNPVKREEYLLDTKEQLEKLSALVERILSMSMKERGNFRLEVSETNIRDMFEKIVQETRLRTAKACDIQIEADDNLTAVFDAKLMSSVVSTLVDNAVKYSGESVRILLKAIRKSDKLFLSVSDNGIGIAQEHQRHVFEKFYRVPHGDVHDVKGYGIGLYFAKTIVERHGGRISLTSTPGEGSTFTVVQRIRKTDQTTPVIFLTAKTEVDDVVAGFETGANDYIRKPFAMKELIVRIKALTGRVSSKEESESSIFNIGDYRFDADKCVLLYIPTGETEQLPHREAEVLRRFCQNFASIVPMQNVLLELWGNDDFFCARSLQVLITRIRHRLSKDKRIHIINIRGNGYKLSLD